MQRNTNTTLRRTAAMAAVSAIVLAGCGGGSDDDIADRETTDAAADSGTDRGRAGDLEIEYSDRTDEPAEQPVGEPADEPGARDEPAADDAGGSAFDAESIERAARTTADGGLFDEPDQPEATPPARDEDNVFAHYGYRDFVETRDDPLSTFALDVDTGSYTVGRRWLDEGRLPPIESVRPEEYVNAFRYDYDEPRSGLELSVDGGPSPFDDDNHLVRIGVQGEVVADDERGPAALTFVVDTSGSMDRDDRLELVKDSLAILLDELDDDDTVAIVTYDDASGVVLHPTPSSDRDVIIDAIDHLRPGGSTNLEAGLRTGYDLAREAFRDDGINRLVLASDGVANVGTTDPDDLARMIRDDADRGIDLVTVGFGMGNFNDVTMEQLADQGDGFYAYVDTDDEAERLFEDELTATLLTIAEDAKIQVEFDPEVVEEYRLIGFENRGVRDRDFRNDDVDAGELGAGHQVTAIYEIELERGVDPSDRREIGEVFLRWQDPTDGEVVEIDEDIDLRDIEPVWSATTADFQLATVVATYAELMRDNPHAVRVDIDDLAHEADRLADEIGDRDVDELADLIERAADLY